MERSSFALATRLWETVRRLGRSFRAFRCRRGRSPALRLLARIEASLCRDIQTPDRVPQLTVPVEVAVLRNETRGKREPEDYVRLRHSLIANLDFGRTPSRRPTQTGRLSETVLESKKASL